MKNKSIFGLLIFGAMILVAFSKSALAENAVFSPKEPTEEQISKVASGCADIKKHLTKLHSTDALKRVNLGQIYESISSDMMAKLNTRIVMNKLNGSELVSSAADFSENMKYFRENYKIYEQELKKLQDMDCASNGREFYLQLEKVRYQRKELNYNVSKLKEIANDYKKQLTTFKEGLK